MLARMGCRPLVATRGKAPRLAALQTMLSVAPVAAQPADTILLNGKIVTLDTRSTIAEALAIRGDRIIATGTAADVRPHTGPATRVVDLDGRTVIPGLIDSHIHAIRAGLRYQTEASFIGTTTIAEGLDRIRLAAAQSQPDTWIVVGGGWTPGQFVERRRPTEAEVAAAAPGRRVYIQLFYRAALLTAPAREALGFLGDAGLPPNAILDRGEDGQPNGWITGDTAAITGLFDRLPKPCSARLASRDHGRPT